jgi:hypothetical protein
MANILFLAVENLRQYRGSPPRQGSLLHLVYESAMPNNGMQRTRAIALLSSTLNRRSPLMPGVMPPECNSVKLRMLTPSL